MKDDDPMPIRTPEKSCSMLHKVCEEHFQQAADQDTVENCEVCNTCEECVKVGA